MIPYEVDPTLHTAPPAPPQLDDGFAPPADNESPGGATSAHPAAPPQNGQQPDRSGLNSEKSSF
ncbi:MAG TPA: hypothetical protein VLJ86_04765 [Ramlibacter sp.]|nr:hypothetical protein [Ramlibacter sp.]